MVVGEIQMHDLNAYVNLVREDGGRWCVFECLHILHLEQRERLLLEVDIRKVRNPRECDIELDM